MTEKIYKVKKSTVLLMYSALLSLVLIGGITFYYGANKYFTSGMNRTARFSLLFSQTFFMGALISYFNLKRNLINKYQFHKTSLYVFLFSARLTIYPSDIEKVHYGFKSCQVFLKNKRVFYLTSDQEDLNGFKMRMQRFFPSN